MSNPAIFDIALALKRQAKLRLWLVSALVVAGFLLLPFIGKPSLAIFVMAATHLIYAALVYLVINRAKSDFSRWPVVVTAIADALMLTMWIILMGKIGVLMTPLYNFTTIGYGMRSGSRRLLQTSQVTSFLGLAVLPFADSYWHNNPIIWVSCLIAVIIIPWYAGGLTDRLHLAIEFAESESKAKTNLLARVSHELRTPLGGISNAAELIKRESTTERPRHLADTILALSSHLLADINDLLDQSKLSLGKLQLSSEPADLSQQMDLIRAAIESNAQKRGISFTAVLDPRIVDRVVVDARWLARLLINLLGNAVKFTEVGEVSLNISLMQKLDAEYIVRFTVKDTGVGIPREHQREIFDPFVQIMPTSSFSMGGAGLGLAISKQVVELMGGTLRVSSELGMGSTFWFDLRMPRTAQAPTEQAAAVEHGATPATDAKMVRQRKILVVDDNATNRYLLQELLRSDGYYVLAASNGDQALQILSSDNKFDLLLLDYNLGEMDGGQVLKTYRFGCINPVPAYFLTADATEVTALKLRDSGALGILTKPVSSQELRAAVDHACAVSNAAQGKLSVAGERPAVQQPSSRIVKPLRPVPVVYVDMEVIEKLKNIGTRSGFIVELLESANKDISKNTIKIVEALSAKEFKASRDASHALKGICLETGAIRLMNIAQAVMRAEDIYLLEQKSKLIADLRDASRNTIEALRDVIAETLDCASGF